MGLRLWNTIGKRPGMVLATLYVLCVLAFLATIPLPRIDNQLVGSDGTFYYAYLPSIWLDGDLDFANQYRYLIGPGRESIAGFTPRGLPVNAYPVGSALLWSPFFLAAHLAILALRALGATIPADGMGYPYQTATLLGSITYGAMGLWLIYRLCRRRFGPSPSVAAVALLWLGSSVLYYVVAEPSMVHTSSLFALGLFFYLWDGQQGEGTSRGWLVLGLVGGLVVLVRVPDAIFVALPVLGMLPQLLRAPARILPRLALFAGAALLAFAPQLIVWQILYGSLISGYLSLSGGLAFHWLSPQWIQVLFSGLHGLYTWHPLLLAATAGLVLLARRSPRERRFTLLLVIGLLLQLYLISAWREWWQGDSFGGRMFISAMPIFALGLAALLDRLSYGRYLTAVMLVSIVLLAWNGLFMLEYRLGCFSRSAPLSVSQVATATFQCLPDFLLRR
ncbi:MAG: hypothetical protein IT330_18480 [Anaerolineae bacterium]|nr:hypothetical protein [Anaerolineae bacterium]